MDDTPVVLRLNTPTPAHSILQCYSQQDFEYYIRSFNTIPATQSSILEVANMIRECGIALLDHLNGFFRNVKYATDKGLTFGPALKELAFVIMSKFVSKDYIEKDFPGAYAIVLASKISVAPSSDMGQVDKLWTKYRQRPDKLQILIGSIGRMNLNLFEKELLRKLEMSLVAMLAREISQPLPKISWYDVVKCGLQTPICCRSSFNFQENIYLQQTFGQDELVIMPGDLTSKNDYIQLKNQICALLNHHGGVIFYGINPSDRTVVGNFLYTHQLQQTKNIISTVFQCFRSDQATRLYRIHNVPIKESGKYKPGWYVTRIVVYPHDTNEIYYWVNSKGDEFPFVKEKLKASQIPYDKLYDILTKKIKSKSQCKWKHQGKCKDCEVGEPQSLKTKEKQISEHVYKNVCLLLFVNALKAQNLYRQIWQTTQNFRMFTPQSGKRLLHVIETDLEFSELNNIVLRTFPDELPSGKKPFLVNVTLQMKILLTGSVQQQAYVIQYIEGQIQNMSVRVDRSTNTIHFKQKLEAVQVYLFLYENSIKVRFLGHSR